MLLFMLPPAALAMLPPAALVTVLMLLVQPLLTAGPPSPPPPTLWTAGPAPLPAHGAVWPLDPRPDVVSGFSPPADPWASGHRGVDLLGSAGETVRSAQAGTVSFVGTIAGIGVVVVRHGGTRSTYQPVNPAVHVGEHVDAGQPLGTLAFYGSHCFPRVCLHWGLLAGDHYLDPLSLVGAAVVRLLPLDAPDG